MDEQRKFKQNLLKSEILDKGHDGNTFAAFMESRKNGGGSRLLTEGSNIDNWNLEELEFAIKEFRNQQLINLDNELLENRNTALQNFEHAEYFEPVNFVTVEE